MLRQYYSITFVLIKPCVSHSQSTDDEPSEEKDHFVAQLYKFMDDRGTPINRGPQVANRDLDLFKLFRLVQNLGGYNRVTNQMKWRLVYSKMNLPQSASHDSRQRITQFWGGQTRRSH